MYKIEVRMSQEEEKYITTDVEEIPKMVASLRQNFFAESPTSYRYRIEQIKQLLKFVEECEHDLINACQYYYGGTDTHHWLTRLWIVKFECHYAIKNLKKWMKSDKISQSLPISLMWSASIEYHALGVVTIISPWNYPITLLLRPLIGAIAAGNAIILKPSEITDKVSRVYNDKILNYLDPKMISVICGGPTETTALLNEKLDYVLYTGGGFVGKIVMKACSNNLTPCCLELGGKNPVIIDDNVDLEISLKRILFGRFDWNCGQS